MTDLERLCSEASIVLQDNELNKMRDFIEKWVPILTNDMTVLRNERNFLELELNDLKNQMEG